MVVMDRQWTVGASAALLSLENVAVLAGLLVAGSAPVVVLLVLLGKFWFCAQLLELRIGALALLVVWESFMLAVALLNTSLTLPGQLALFASATASSTLLALSIPLYAPDPDRVRRT